MCIRDSVKDVDLYVATPEVKEYTGAYSKPSDFTDLETSSYYNYTYNRNDRLLSGNSKSRFNTNMKDVYKRQGYDSCSRSHFTSTD